MSSNPSVSLNPLLGILPCSFTPYCNNQQKVNIRHLWICLIHQQVTNLTFIRCRLDSVSLGQMLRWGWRRITRRRNVCTVVLARSTCWMSIHLQLLLHIADATYWSSLPVCNPASVFRATHTCQFVLDFFRIGPYSNCSSLLQRFTCCIDTFKHATMTNKYFTCINNAQWNMTTFTSSEL